MEGSNFYEGPPKQRKEEEARERADGRGHMVRAGQQKYSFVFIT